MNMKQIKPFTVTMKETNTATGMCDRGFHRQERTRIKPEELTTFANDSSPKELSAILEFLNNNDLLNEDGMEFKQVFQNKYINKKKNNGR
jgi:hypothetical protein